MNTWKRFFLLSGETMVKLFSYEQPLNQTLKQPFGADLFCIKSSLKFLNKPLKKKLTEELYCYIIK